MGVELKEGDKSACLSTVVPTLFIGLGGAGAEVLLRVRRRILNSSWGDSENPICIANLTEFPLAQFINFDLDAGSTTESGQATTTDPLANLVKFSDEEKLIFKLDMDKYLRTDGELNKYPLIASWFPLTRKKALELGIDPSKGAGQIRSLSRLYFFDKYVALRSMIEGKIGNLLAGVSNKAKTERLGLELEPASLRVVVIASTAGGTGSGSFLDMGYLSKWLASKRLTGAKVDLCLMLPSGYSGHGKSRTEANTYAALMEMEACIGQGLKYVDGWKDNESDDSKFPNKPYDDVYLIDTGNIAGAHGDIKDMYDMIADEFFESFSMAEFANRKRSISVCKLQYKFVPCQAQVDREIYGNMVIQFSRAYSSFGRATIDFSHDTQDGLDAGEENPIFAKLDQHPNLDQLLGDFLQRAMPWVSARLDEYLWSEWPSHQYICLIGVKDARKFETKYGALLKSRLPLATLMTANSINFLEIDTPNKIVCYTELVGLPLPSLKALDDWYTAYRNEEGKIPLHTHRRKSIFVHPREMTTDELAARVEDFKLFVQAVALGVLTRTENDEDAGLYKIKIGEAYRSVGDEKVVRQEGFAPEYRSKIQQSVELVCERLTSQDQLALLIALLEYYAGEVYPVSIMRDEMYCNREQRHFPTLLCEKLLEEWTTRIERKFGADQSRRMIISMREVLSKWTDEIPGSTADVYRDELYKEIKPKRVLRQDVLKEGWQADGPPPL